MKRFVSVFMCLFMLIIVSACGKSTEAENTKKPTEKPTENNKLDTPYDLADLKVINMKLETNESGTLVVSGQLKNTAKIDLTSVKVEYAVDDRTEYFYELDGLKSGASGTVQYFDAPASQDLGDVKLRRITVNLMDQDKQTTVYTCQYMENGDTSCSFN